MQSTLRKRYPYSESFESYFPIFGLNTERYGVYLRIQSECGKIQTRENSVFGHFTQWFILGVDVLFQSHSRNKVKGQTKRGVQMNKRTGTGKEA